MKDNLPPIRHKTKITLEEQEDGNWVGSLIKNPEDPPILERDTGPETLLLALITHE